MTGSKSFSNLSWQSMDLTLGIPELALKLKLQTVPAEQAPQRSQAIHTESVQMVTHSWCPRADPMVRNPAQKGICFGLDFPARLVLLYHSRHLDKWSDVGALPAKIAVCHQDGYFQIGVSRAGALLPGAVSN